MKSSIKKMFVVLAVVMSFVAVQAVWAQEPVVCIDVKPDTLNINSGSKWVTAYIELDGYNPADIDVSTILLNGEVVPVLDPNYCFVANEDCYLVDATCEPGVIERMVKFNRGDVAAILPLGEEVEITITGKLKDGTTHFEGTDVIRVIEGAFKGIKGDVNLNSSFLTEGLTCIDVKPDTLNINSCGKWVTVYIELDGYNPADIDVSTILLNGEVVPVLDPNYCFVANEDCYLVDATCEPGVIERMVKFNRGNVAAILPLGEEVEITITGKLNDGTTSFEGTDVIPVIEGAFEGHKGDVNCDGAIKVSDLQLILNIFLGTSPPPTDRELWFADCDDNGSINVADILIAINKILGAN